MSNLEVLCIVASGGTVGGIVAWLSWSFGFKRGQREVESVWWRDTFKAVEIKKESDERTISAMQDEHHRYRKSVESKPATACNCGDKQDANPHPKQP